MEFEQTISIKYSFLIFKIVDINDIRCIDKRVCANSFASLGEGGGPHERVVEGERDRVFSEFEVKLWAEGDDCSILKVLSQPFCSSK